MSAYISSKHAEAQHAYANRQAAGGKRRNISATGSDVDRGGRSGQRSGRSTGRGRTNGRSRAYINNVDVTDPHRNFTATEWEKLGTMRGVALQMREGASNRGGRRGNDNRSLTNSTAQRTASVVSVNAGSTANKNATTQ